MNCYWVVKNADGLYLSEVAFGLIEWRCRREDSTKFDSFAEATTAACHHDGRVYRVRSKLDRHATATNNLTVVGSP